MALTLSEHQQEVKSSNVGPESGYSEISWFFPVPLCYTAVLCYITVRPTAISCPNLHTTIVSCKRRSWNPQRRFLRQDKSKVFPLHFMEACRGVGPLILTLGSNWMWVIASRSGRFTPGERSPGTLRIGSWVGLRAGMDVLGEAKILSSILGLSKLRSGEIINNACLCLRRYTII